MGKHLEQTLPSVYTLQCLTGKVDNDIITITSAVQNALGLDSCRMRIVFHRKEALMKKE